LDDVGLFKCVQYLSIPYDRTVVGHSHTILAPLRALRKKGGVVRPVSPMYVVVLKMSKTLHRICDEKCLCLGLLSRDSCRRISECKSVMKEATLLKTWVSR